jgi:hypothetical protein
MVVENGEHPILLKVTAPIPEGLSNSACFQVEAIHETIFNAFVIENHEFSKKIDKF